MKRILLALAATGVLLVAARSLYRALAPDETKIRWMVERMVAGYNTDDVGDCIGPLAEDWRHEEYHLDRDELRAGLLHASLQDRNTKTKKLDRRVELDSESLFVEVSGSSADLRCEASFSRRRDETWKETWRVAVEADLEKRGRDWKIVRSRHRDLRGTQLSR